MIFQRHPVRKLGAIYLGGVVGALLRVGLSEAFPHPVDAWPWPTFAVNLAGAFLIGFFFATFRDHPPDRLHHPFFATGVCGTLTTFSTVQLELFNMVDAGQTGLAFAYLIATLAAGYLALRLGFMAEQSRTATESES
jgi:CrcB protein